MGPLGKGEVPSKESKVLVTESPLSDLRLVSYRAGLSGIIDLYLEQGPVVQSMVSLTSSLVVKMLTVLVRRMSNSQVFC